MESGAVWTVTSPYASWGIEPIQRWRHFTCFNIQIIVVKECVTRGIGGTQQQSIAWHGRFRRINYGMTWRHPAPLHRVWAEGMLEGLFQALPRRPWAPQFRGFRREYTALMVSCDNNFQLTMSVLQHKDSKHQKFPPVIYTWCKLKMLQLCFAFIPKGFSQVRTTRWSEGFEASGLIFRG